MKKFYHVIVGITIAYVLFILFKIYEFPLSKEYANNYLVLILGAFFATMFSFFWERWQERSFGIKFNIYDIYRSAFGGVVGALLSMFYVNYILATILIIISLYLVLFRRKK